MCALEPRPGNSKKKKKGLWSQPACPKRSPPIFLYMLRCGLQKWDRLTVPNTPPPPPCLPPLSPAVGNVAGLAPAHLLALRSPQTGHDGPAPWLLVRTSGKMRHGGWRDERSGWRFGPQQTGMGRHHHERTSPTAAQQQTTRMAAARSRPVTEPSLNLTFSTSPCAASAGPSCCGRRQRQ
jgi:hypothetical protein